MYLADYLFSIHELDGEFALKKAEKTFNHQQKLDSSLEDRMISSIKLDEYGLPYFDYELNRVENIAHKIAIGILYSEGIAFSETPCLSTIISLTHWMDTSTLETISAFLDRTIQQHRFSYGITSSGEGVEVSMLICNTILACVKA